MRIHPTSKTVAPTTQKIVNPTTSCDWVIGWLLNKLIASKMSIVAAINTNQASNNFGNGSDFFQMLLGSSFINFIPGGTPCRRPK